MIELNVQQMARNIKAIQTASKELRTLLVGEETMKALAVQGVTLVKARALNGMDADGRAFAPYTDKYGADKSAVTGSSTPNLVGFNKPGSKAKSRHSAAGSMLNNMVVSYIEPGRARIIFNSDQQANKAAGNSRKRDFFDIRLPVEVSALLGTLDRRVNKILKQLGLA